MEKPDCIDHLDRQIQEKARYQKICDFAKVEIFSLNFYFSALYLYFFSLVYLTSYHFEFFLLSLSLIRHYFLL